MKNIRKKETCQTEITHRLNNFSLLNFVPIKLRGISDYDRFVTFVFNIIKTKGRCSFSQTKIGQALRLSRRSIIRYTHKLKEDPRFKVSQKFWSTNWITFACLSASLLWSPVTLAKFSLELININSYSYNRKRVCSAHEIKKEKKRWESITMNVNKLFKDPDSQPLYDQQSYQKREDSNKTTPAMYSTWQPEIRKPEDKQKAFETMKSNIDTQEFNRFISLVGIDVARAMFKKVYENTTTD